MIPAYSAWRVGVTRIRSNTFSQRARRFRRERRGFGGVDDSGDAVFDEGDVEIDQQAEVFAGDAEVGQELLFVDRAEGFDGF